MEAIQTTCIKYDIRTTFLSFVMDPLPTKGYIVLRQFLSKQYTNYLAQSIWMEKNRGNLRSNDGQVEKALFGHSLPSIKSLLFGVQEKVSTYAKKTLLPTYCYSRIYYKDSVLEPHIDRPSCEYSLTIHLDGSHPWDILMKDLETKETVGVLLNPGDAVLYKGCEIEHARDCYLGDWYLQCFLHYVDANGIYQSCSEKELGAYIPPASSMIGDHTEDPSIRIYSLQHFTKYMIPPDSLSMLHKKAGRVPGYLSKHCSVVFLSQKEYTEPILSFVNAQHILPTLQCTQISSDLLLLEEEGMYDYIEHIVYTFTIHTLWVQRGSCTIEFPNQSKQYVLHENDMLLVPASYAYLYKVKTEKKETSVIVRSFLV
jgi:hypothetical protein